MSDKEQILKALEKFDNKIDKLDHRLDAVEKILVKQEANIEHHVKRTDVAEANLELLRQDVKPIQKHVNYMEGALKSLGVLGTAVAIMAGIIKIVELFL